MYRDHLPLLGEQGPGRSGPHGLQIGDQVRVFHCWKTSTVKYIFHYSLK